MMREAKTMKIKIVAAEVTEVCFFPIISHTRFIALIINQMVGSKIAGIMLY
jgi:hypothetical protein